MSHLDYSKELLTFDGTKSQCFPALLLTLIEYDDRIDPMLSSVAFTVEEKALSII